MRRMPVAWPVWSLTPVLPLEALRLLSGAAFSWSDLCVRWAFVAAVLLMSRFSRPYLADETYRIWPWPGLAAGAAGALAAILAAYLDSTVAAWLALAAWYSLLPGVALLLLGRCGRAARLIGAMPLALLWGVAPVTFAEVEARFAEEEFFAALQALALTAFGLLLLVAAWRIEVWSPSVQRSGVRVRPFRIGLLIGLLAAAGALAAAWAYQRSFYPYTAPSYPGISTKTPFRCGAIEDCGPRIAGCGSLGESSTDSATRDPQPAFGQEVFRRLLARVEANPLKGTPEYGMLALGSGEYHWANDFRRGLLDEAALQQFTGPANSLKAVQHQATLRAYYYARVRAALPDLFSLDEQQRVHAWFAKINGRALTVEWVDWLYGLAFGKWPEGPYENQETGAGLLATLEYEGLAAPELSAANRDYLARNLRGWATRFRNSDDTLIYQPVWLRNAFLQSRFSGVIDPQRRQQSFDWLLLQALPDGAPSGYNHSSSVSLAGSAYLGALQLNDPRYVWLADRALAALEARHEPLFAQLGAEQPVYLTGHPPTEGSCLLYGDSGLPNRSGSLAPDKIVFREGWSQDAAYLALNLRFTGWHRYKATNTVSLVYRSGPLAAERLDSRPFAWLPSGRSLFRDKRIPRENLNGMTVARTGAGDVLFRLTGMGGPWAQDPPFYANVERFTTDGDIDSSSTTITGWHGWQQRRTIAFYRGGPIVVIDQARGPLGSRAAIFWHVAAAGVPQGQRLTLRSGPHPAELLILAGEPPEGVQMDATVWGPEELVGMRITARDAASGRLDVISVFLTDGWVGAAADVVQAPGGATLRIVRADRQAVTFRLPPPPEIP